MVKIVDWNIAFTHQPWRELVEMGADVALLQETCNPPPDVADQLTFSPYAHWLTDGYALTSYRPARVVKLSDRVDVEWFEQVHPHRYDPEMRQMAVSTIGLSDAAIIRPKDGTEEFIAVSIYGGWQTPHPYTSRNGQRWIYTDGSVHRVISDISTFVRTYDAEEPDHRVIAAGDLNVSFDDGNPFSDRARNILERFSVLGLEWMGPHHPNGRQVVTKREDLPPSTLVIPTYHTVSQTPETADIQLDHVFVSRGLHRSVAVRALNEVDEWGSSDHCRILIEVAPPDERANPDAGT